MLKSDHGPKKKKKKADNSGILPAELGCFIYALLIAGALGLVILGIIVGMIFTHYMK